MTSFSVYNLARNNCFDSTKAMRELGYRTRSYQETMHVEIQWLIETGKVKTPAAREAHTYGDAAKAYIVSHRKSMKRWSVSLCQGIFHRNACTGCRNGRCTSKHRACPMSAGRWKDGM